MEELVDHPGIGRSFTRELRPALHDVAPGGRVRLDALARWLQDIALADITDAGQADGALWVVRRTRLAVRRFPRFGEPATVMTFCSGLGRMWAQRRTDVSTPDGGRAQAVALWVHLDRRRLRPRPLSPQELELYTPSAAGRRVRARLQHPDPPPGGVSRPWTLRATELDLADHINNAAYWAPLEEELLAGSEPAAADVEIEFRTPAQPGAFTFCTDGAHRWLLGADGTVHASYYLA